MNSRYWEIHIIFFFSFDSAGSITEVSYGKQLEYGDENMVEVSIHFVVWRNHSW